MQSLPDAAVSIVTLSLASSARAPFCAIRLDTVPADQRLACVCFAAAWVRYLRAREMRALKGSN